MAKRRPPRDQGSRPSRAERLAARRADLQVVSRPFAGRKDECDLVCLREIVPSATAELTLTDHPALGDHAGTTITLGTVLPLTWPAMKRADGQVILAMQTPLRSVDVSRDYAQAILAALDAEPGDPMHNLPEPPADHPTFSDLVVDQPLTVTCHTGFDWWVPEAPEEGSEAAEAMEQANADVVPTERLASVSSAYWCRIGEKAHLRWAMDHDEEPLLDALARLKSAGQLSVGEGSRFVGSFRALGIVVPVWDVALDATAESIEDPAVDLRTNLDQALANPAPLTGEERKARAEIASRQVTLR